MQCVTWKKRNPNRRELNPDPNGAPPLRSRAREQEFVVAKTAIGSLNDMLGGAQLTAPGKMFIDAMIATPGKYRAVGSGQVPDARPTLRQILSARVAYEYLGALIRKRVVQLAAKHYADIRSIQPKRKFRGRLHGSSAIGRRRVNFHTLQ